MAADFRLWQPLLDDESFRRLEAGLVASGPGLIATGLVEGGRALLLALLAARCRARLMVVVPDDAALGAIHRDMAALAPTCGLDPRRIHLFPALDADPWDGIAPHPEVVRERAVALGRLARGEVALLLVPARALLGWLPAPDEWRALTTSVNTGDTLPPDRFVLQAMGLGYRRVDTVSAPGEVSRRGGIVDVFPPESSEPVRIELFGDAVESLRSFDTDNQRSTGKLEQVVVGPATESPPTDRALGRLAGWLEAGRDAAAGDDAAVRAFRERLDQLAAEGAWPGFESLARLTAERPVTLFEHAAELLLVVADPERAGSELLRAADDLARAHAASDDRVLPPPDVLHVDPALVRQRLGQAALELHELADPDAPSAAERTIHLASRSARAYGGRLGDLAADLRRARAEGTRTVCVMRAEGSAQRLTEILAEYDLPATRVRPGETELGARGGIWLAVGGLRRGFELPGVALVVLAERDVLGEERKTAEQKRGRRAAFVSDFRDLKPGDLVVHVDHGIARYAGLGRPRGGSLNRDFMVLEFAGGDRLFVPVDRLDLVQKYNGAGGAKPRLDRLGGPGWERVKRKVRASVRDMAQELLELYARRAAARGHAFPADTPWQKELEDAFPFELTPDQARALAEVKADLEAPRPMDRLLVGDVGFGKTEIAVRAAFKVVLDGRQVALLTPTTVLATQHHATLTERFAAFPVRVEMISRFRSAAEVRQVLRDAASGAVDVIVGTHRLLSRDVRFKQLGLLVVDEEQRFGVAHKERLKALTTGVDVLAMTATPIPRTLQMSLAGVRDMSVIETPPPGRLAIQTYLLPFRKNVLAQALRQELRRAGQAFVVHNRVETLPALASAIERLVPEARVVTAHGQLRERQLESVMLRFLRHEADVLVTTTIIENGLDIPRANTIIVNRADRFGLAQLYQLRGRVGRSDRHAYAYFVIPGREALSDEARKRLRALAEFSELGAGFRLAAADLEIRGAGELLGPRQHGHIAALGFDLYCQMLERAVAELQGEPAVEREPPSLHLGVDIKIPASYLPEPGDRLALYKRLAQAKGTEDLDRLQAETEDRFGHLPAAAENLFAMARARLAAEQAGVRSIDLVGERLQIRFHDQAAVEPTRLLALLERHRGALTPSGMLRLPAPPRGAERIQAVIELLDQMLGRSAA